MIARTNVADAGSAPLALPIGRERESTPQRDGCAEKVGGQEHMKIGTYIYSSTGNIHMRDSLLGWHAIDNLTVLE